MWVWHAATGGNSNSRPPGLFVSPGRHAQCVPLDYIPVKDTGHAEWCKKGLQLLSLENPHLSARSLSSFVATSSLTAAEISSGDT